MPKTIPTTNRWESQKTSALPQCDALSPSFRFAYALGTVAQKPNTSKSRSELETSKSRSESNISESRSAPSTDDQVSPCIKQIFPSISHKSRSGSTRTVTRGNIPLNCLVLDSGATVSILANIEFLKNIFTTKRPLTIHCGGDSIVANQAGSLCDGLEDLPLPKNGYFHHKNGLANLLSLGLIAKEFRVVLDTSIDNAFYIFNDDGSYIRFECQPNGLYYEVPPCGGRRKKPSRANDYRCGPEKQIFRTRLQASGSSTSLASPSGIPYRSRSYIRYRTQHYQRLLIHKKGCQDGKDYIWTGR